jgi:hypothetical protein
MTGGVCLAVEKLAECLYLRMERMDPSGRGLWEDLPDGDREFYRAGVREILLEKTLLTLAMGDSRDSPTTTE